MARIQTTFPIIKLNNFSIKTFSQSITLATDSDTTTVGLTPNGVVLGAGIIVSSAITGLDSADHHIKLGVAGTVGKYCDASQGGAETSIAKNKKASFISDMAITKETAALILTIDGGSDNTPTAGTVVVEVTYMIQEDIPNL